MTESMARLDELLARSARAHKVAGVGHGSSVGGPLLEPLRVLATHKLACVKAPHARGSWRQVTLVRSQRAVSSSSPWARRTRSASPAATVAASRTTAPSRCCTTA